MQEAGPLAGKRVFVTGHTGFKGSWLLLLLDRLGARPTGYSLAPPTSPALFEAAGLLDLVARHHEADIRDTARLAAAVREAAPDVVLHLAAQPLVRLSHREPLDTFSTNVVGTASLLDAVRQAGRPCTVLVVTSDKCYEPHADGRPHAEDDRLGGHDPYSASKGAAELVAEAYRRSFFPPERLAEHGVQLATVRAGNVIGGGDWAKDRIVCDLARGLIAGETIHIRRPDAIRPWQHVLEPLSGYLKVAEHLVEKNPLPSEGWNFGPDTGSEQTVGALAALVCDLWGRPDALKIQRDPKAVHEAALLKLDSTKAHVLLGWQPRWGFRDGVERTVDWYRAYADGRDMRAFTLGQIDDHLAAPSAAAHAEKGTT